MSTCQVAPPRRRWLTTVFTSLTLLSILTRCEHQPFNIPPRGAQWTLGTVRVPAIGVEHEVVTPAHGYSRTLYVGFPPGSISREAVALLRFAEPDTEDIAIATEARLVLFRRAFGDELIPDQQFQLFSVETDDTLWTWTETDTGLNLDDISNQATLIPVDTATLVEEDILWYEADSTISAQYLEFTIKGTWIRNWTTGLPPNGFLVRAEGPEGSVAFHSYQSDRGPYMSLTLPDTTEAGEDTIQTQYFGCRADISVYPSYAPGSVDTLRTWIHLNYSEGIRSRLYFTPFDSIGIHDAFASARLILSYRDSGEHTGDQFHLFVSREGGPPDNGDSTTSVVYSEIGEDLIINVRDLLISYASQRSDEAAGGDTIAFQLSVLPWNYDFDHLLFWGLSADLLLRPRLEIVYSQIYGGGTR